MPARSQPQRPPLAGPPLVVGTAGHIDHGKTALVRALTGIDTDRLREEKERGITIELGFAPLDLAGWRIAFIDVPGHERFVKTMLAGASGIDAVLLVVAADESVRPQTREHFEICRLLEVPRGIVAMTKADLAPEDLRSVTRADIAELVAGSFLEGAPVIAVSVRSGEGLEDLRAALAGLAASARPRPADGPARLPVDRSFTLRGFGTVVTGTLVAGSIHIGEELVLLPSGRTARVRSLQVHGEPVERAVAGQRTAVNLQGISPEEAPRGETLASPGTLPVGSLVDLEIEMLADAPAPLRNNERVRLHAGTRELLGRVRLLEGERLEPGGRGLAQIGLEAPMAVARGDRVILRRYSPQRTVAGGRVVDPVPPKRRRGGAPLASLRVFAAAADRERIRLLVAEGGAAGATLPVLAHRSGLRAPEVESTVAALEQEGVLHLLRAEPRRALAAEALAVLTARARGLLEHFHEREPLRPGMPREELRARLVPGAPADVFRALLELLADAGSLAILQDLVALPGHAPRVGGEEARLRAALESAIRDAGWDPPSREALAAIGAARGAAGERMLHLLQREGLLVRLSDGRYVHTASLAALRSALYEFRKMSEIISIAAFKDLIGVSRKNAIPLLEHLDAERVTVRRGNDRYIMPPRQT